MDIRQLILDADILVKSVLIILFIASIVSWWIFIYKKIILKNNIKKSLEFLKKIKETKDLDESYEDANSVFYKSSYLSNLYISGYNEIKELVDKNVDKESLDNIKRSLESEKEKTLSTLQSNLPILATISSSSPFIGLFGTVWGIMNSFIGLTASTSSSTLNAVAPGIAEALITTAFGILAAIPALIFYNHLNSLLEKVETESNNFSNYFINLIYKEFIQADNN